jgi:hypothetical protein
MTNVTKAVLWDLDSTICNTRHRQPMIPAIRAKAGPTWEDYSRACTDDTPVEGTIALVRLLDSMDPLAAVRQYAVSGRSECARDATLEWFKRHQVPIDDVFLRPDGDHTPNGRYKVGVIRRLRESGIDVVLLVEDWKQTADYIREKTGVPVLLVQGDYDPEAGDNP